MADQPISITNTMSSTSPATATLTSGMSATQAKQILDSLGINVNDVLSAGNISQTINNPAPAPDDLLGIRRNLYSTLGVDTSQQDYQSKLASALGASTQLSNDLTALSGRPVSVSKFTGQQSQLERTRAGSIKALEDAANIALSNYQAKKSEADTQFGILESEVKDKRALQAQYPGAKISVSDSFDSAFKKIDKYQEQVKKDAWKDDLKKMAMSYGVKTKGKSTKDLEKAISKVNKAALDRTVTEFNKKMQQMDIEIANTKSIMATRGKDSATTDLNNQLTQLKIQQAQKELSGQQTPLEVAQTKQLELENQMKQMEIDLNKPTEGWSWSTSNLNPTNWFK